MNLLLPISLNFWVYSKFITMGTFACKTPGDYCNRKSSINVCALKSPGASSHANAHFCSNHWSNRRPSNSGILSFNDLQAGSKCALRKEFGLNMFKLSNFKITSIYKLLNRFFFFFVANTLAEQLEPLAHSCMVGASRSSSWQLKMISKCEKKNYCYQTNELF